MTGRTEKERVRGGESVIANRSSLETLFLRLVEGGFRLISWVGGSQVRSPHLGMWIFAWVSFHWKRGRTFYWALSLRI